MVIDRIGSGTFGRDGLQLNIFSLFQYPRARSTSALSGAACLRQNVWRCARSASQAWRRTPLAPEAGTPAPIMEKISAAFGDAMKDASVVKQLVKLGATAVTDTPAEFKKFISDDRAKWQKLAKEAKIVAQ